MQKIFILDTNVLLYDADALTRFADNTVVVPIEVLEELNNFKRDLSERGQNARASAQFLDGLRSEGNLGEGVALENGGMLRIYAGRCEDHLSAFGLRMGRTVENRILNLAIDLGISYPDEAAIVVSKSLNLRIKADALGIYAEDYEFSGAVDDSMYSGHEEIVVEPPVLTELRQNRCVTFDDRQFMPNEYLLLRTDEDEPAAIIGRVVGEEGTRVVPIRNCSDGILGIRPLNAEQACALDALLNDDIKLVSLVGKAGTGKTLLAVAAGLQKVLREEMASRLLISRPTIPMGRDIGFIPGDIEEKMRPWMQPLYDAVEMIMELDRQSKARFLPADLMDSSDIAIEPLSYIRGRSIPRQFMIIDESQNLTPLEVKTIITRVGHGTKIVLTGDVYQIDNPYVDKQSNGFAYLINRFASEPIAAHVTLTKGERSELAELAANIL